MLGRPRTTRPLSLYLQWGVGGAFFLLLASLVVISQMELRNLRQLRDLQLQFAQQGYTVSGIQRSIDSQVALAAAALADGSDLYRVSIVSQLEMEQEGLATLEVMLAGITYPTLEQDKAELKVALTALWEQALEPIRRKQPVEGGIRTLTEHSIAAVTHLAEIGRQMQAQQSQRVQKVESWGRKLVMARVATITLSVVCTLVLLRWLLARITRPLAALVQKVTTGRITDPSEARSVREVELLDHALFALQEQIHQREWELKADHTRTQQVQQFTEIAQQQTTEEDLLGTFDQALRRLLAPSSATLLLKSGQDEGLAWAYGDPLAQEALGCRILRDAKLCRSLLGVQPVTHPVLDPMACRCELGVPPEGSYLCLPLLASGERLGLVSLQAPTADHWIGPRIQVARAMANVAAATLQTLRALRISREQAIRDALTGAFNRRFLEELLPKLVAQAQRQGTPLTALMIDLDHFKRVNDTHGHDTGDRVLQRCANLLRAQSRASDVLVRYGGEEFTLLLPGADLPTALVTAERIRQEVQDHVPEHPPFPADLRLTCSLGLAVLTPALPNGEALLAAADQALYDAKRSGRNQVRCHGCEAPPASPAASPAATGPTPREEPS